MKELSILIFFLFAAYGFSSAQTQKVILDEDFNTNKNNWQSYQGPAVTYLIYNGKYIFSSSDSVHFYNIDIPVAIDTQSNFSFAVTATHTDGVINYPYGLFFGASDLSNYYSFYITNNGYFRVAKSTSANYTELIKWTANPAIKTGNYVDNILQIAKTGKDWKFSINGQLLATIPAMPLLGTKAGFSQTNYQRVEFDDVKVIEN